MNSVADIVRGLVTAFQTPNQRATYRQTLTLVAGVPIGLDFRALINQQRMDNVQGVWIDNSAGTSSFVIQVPATGQNFQVPAGYQGCTILPMTPDLQVVIFGAGSVPVMWVNFPLQTAVWLAAVPAPVTLPNAYIASTSLALTVPGPVMQIRGSATKKITFKAIRGYELANAAADHVLVLDKNSTSASGTSVALQISPLDTASPASSASALAFTVPGANGNIITQILSQHVTIGAGSTGLPIFQYDALSSGQGITLRGLNEYLVLFVNATPAGYVGNFIMEWTEE